MVTIRFELSRAGSISFLLLGIGVYCPVQFHDEPQLHAVEVEDERAHRLLPSEFQTVKPAVAQRFPEDPLGWRHDLTQLLCSELHLRRRTSHPLNRAPSPT